MYYGSALGGIDRFSAHATGGLIALGDADTIIASACGEDDRCDDWQEKVHG